MPHANAEITVKPARPASVAIIAANFAPATEALR